MNKKFISSVLAGACALSMTSIATFAADTAISDLGSDGVATQQVTFTSTTAMPTLKVTVPTTADVVLNPYKIAVTTPISGNDTIMSPEYEIKNESDCGIAVSATVKATPGGGAAMATAALKGTETTKSVFMYLETTDTTDTYYGEYVAKKVTAKKGESLTAEQEAANKACDAQMVITTKETTKEIATLAAGNTTAQSIFFKVQGDAVTAPKTPWVAADKVDLAMTLKITPNANAETGTGPSTPTVTLPTGTTAALTQSDLTGTGVTAFAATAGKNNEYDVTVSGGTNGGSAITIDVASILDTGFAATGCTSSNTSACTAAFNGISKACTFTPADTSGTTDITVTYGDGSDTGTIVLHVTLTA